MSESPSPQGEGLRGLAPLREEGKLVTHRVNLLTGNRRSCCHDHETIGMQ